MNVLSALANTFKGNLDQNFESVIQVSVEYQSNFEPFLDSLRILKSLFKHATSKKILVHTNKIQTILLALLNYEYSKVVGQGPNVTGSYMVTLLNQDGSFMVQYKPIILPLYEAVLAKLNKVDIDQKVKSLSIIVSADLVQSCHSQFTAAQIQSVVAIFLNWLSHKLTRETAFKGLTHIALSETGDNRQTGSSVVLRQTNASNFTITCYSEVPIVGSMSSYSCCQ